MLVLVYLYARARVCGVDCHSIVMDILMTVNVVVAWIYSTVVYITLEVVHTYITKLYHTHERTQ